MSQSDNQKYTNAELLKLAWNTQGGVKGVIHGIDLWIALPVWMLTAPFWLASAWWDQVLAVAPNVLGFTLGGFAIFLGFGSEDFRRVLTATGKDAESTPYMSVSAAFLVFTVFQIAAILLALVAKALYFPTPVWLLKWATIIEWAGRVAGGIGYGIFIYSLVFALRAAIRIFRLSRWYNHYMRMPQKKRRQSKFPSRVMGCSSKGRRKNINCSRRFSDWRSLK
ncbi:hypothetical protein [Achromobacter sp. AONIH1]|uniref:hypothetical protein n=1 Tax=Achromobacter sp. AONIH1 TaxID=1758194 RepID=UPI00131A2F26|nr:hypothetical protein [Achromobacter sp. AONIH1]